MFGTTLLSCAWMVTQIHIFWRTTKNTVIVQLAMRSGRIRVNSHILAEIIPVV